MSDQRNDAIARAVARREQEYLDLLRELVNIDSGSDDHTGLRRITDVLEGILISERFAVERRPAGDLHVLIARRRGHGPTILLNAHMDTVFDVGTAAERPFAIVDGQARGPGVADDKCGIASIIVTAQALAAVDSAADLLIVLTPDEELGSPHSATITRELSDTADIGLCLEAARASGALVSARKGGANLTVHITGRAAHSGVEPEKGIHAGLQMAHTIIALQALNDPAAGITVNAGLIQSGSRPNVIPRDATIQVDVRAWTVADFDRVLRDIQAAVETVHVAGVRTDTTLQVVAPPMEATPGTRHLADLAVEVASDLGFPLEHVATGGMGDANLVATAGIPVLDGLAPIGGDDHTAREWLDVASIVPRVTLLAVLIDRLAMQGLPREPETAG